MTVEDPVGYEFGEWLINLAEEDLYRGGVPQPVREQVFKVLVVFAKNSQRTLNRRELSDAAGVAMHLDQLIYYTRLALGDRSRNVIQNRSGKGYRLALKATPIFSNELVAAVLRNRNAGVATGSQKVRVSFAAILSIQKKDQYILVAAYRRHQFKPFGGVYQYDDKASKDLEYIGFRPEARKPSINDLRGFIAQPDLAGLIKWFKACTGREGLGCINRELIEELEENGFSAIAKAIRNPKFKLKWQVEEGPETVPNKDYSQFRIFDVYEFVPGDSEGLRITNMLWSALGSTNKIVAVTEEEIIAGRTRAQVNLGTHTAYLIGKTKLWPDPPPPYGL
jgi:DNA-binding winged helix-turn-helix (wHTH) protein